MKGRRRKRASQAKSLLFTESPVSILRNVPSPVYASDHPVTANVIPIDGEVSWVGNLSIYLYKHAYNSIQIMNGYECDGTVIFMR